ncbi:MAG TPA: Holliday junction branch migration protein RuvA [Bacteroidia bacterium]|jgi:Holliday junction DNA helicase RuvA|nr:Holliday junction branch migration protein RuvA [Bacteroidia bacterium]
MYAYFEGTLKEKNPAYAIIDCNGVGYILNISLNTFGKIPESGKCKLFAHLSVREDAHVLFGFAEESERMMFRDLISVSGVGEVTARMMLSSMSPPEIQQAIVNGDVSRLKSIKGIGEKSAQRIIVDLRNKMGKESFGIAPGIIGPYNKLKQEALNALEVLGYARNIAERAIDKTIRDEGDTLSLEDLVKRVLKNF